MLPGEEMFNNYKPESRRVIDSKLPEKTVRKVKNFAQFKKKDKVR